MRETTMQESKDFMISEALERLDGDKDFYLELVTEFLDGYEASASEIRTSIVSQDYHALNHSSHSMKSALANLGAMTASTLCFELEKIGRFRQEIERAPKLVEELNFAVARFCELFQQFREEEGG